ncbi:hypothetical protein FUAX_31360 [Fulvitalea axinellae]|uniref:DUF5723 domain-containing protein n=1 Tax=Fulvitalea axinellae TaxID=1182444 RepID=A0AAU9CW34_9BACT|nr:hypothetical protein FUAX_31360 [Fulvitalea axinellae]
MRHYIIKLALLSVFAFVVVTETHAQEGAQVSGSLQLNQNFYVKDSKFFDGQIPPQYDNQKSSTDGWLNLNYRYKNITAGIRYDLLLNSGLRNPNTALNRQGVGNWFVTLDLDKVEITGGYFYDQFGSGAAFRAFEERAQLLDYAIQGLRIKYDFAENWRLKAFVGRQKANPEDVEDDLLETDKAVIKGLNVEGFEKLGELSFAPGISLVNRTLSDEQLQEIEGLISQQNEATRFSPDQNTWTYSVYNTLGYKNFSWLVEYNYKTPEAGFVNPILSNDLKEEKGDLLYSSLTYSLPGFGLIVQYRRMENFQFRTSPLQLNNNGLISYLPAFSRQNTYRLTGRYVPAPQFDGEEAVQADLFLKLSKKQSLNLNGALNYDLNGNEQYKELFAEHKIKFNRRFTLKYGAQYQSYDLAVYEAKSELPVLTAITPFVSAVNRLSKKYALKTELSAMFTEEDQGDWSWFLAELSRGSKYSIQVSHMFNYGNPDADKQLQYFSVFANANFGSHRLSAGFVQQPETVVCNGGVCRLEPAFNGAKLSYQVVF